MAAQPVLQVDLLRKTYPSPTARLWAEIHDRGPGVSGQDFGPAVEDAWSDTGYEYCVDVNSKHLTKVLDHLGEKPGGRAVISEFASYAWCPAFCPLCVLDERTSDGVADDGRRFVVCMSSEHGPDGCVWEPTPTQRSRTRGDGLGNELDIWDKPVLARRRRNPRFP